MATTLAPEELQDREENLFDDDDATLAVTTAAVVFLLLPLKTALRGILRSLQRHLPPF